MQSPPHFRHSQAQAKRNVNKLGQKSTALQNKNQDLECIFEKATQGAEESTPNSPNKRHNTKLNSNRFANGLQIKTTVENVNNDYSNVNTMPNSGNK